MQCNNWDLRQTTPDLLLEICNGRIGFEISFPAVSQHLRALRDAGLVETRKDGTRRYYRARQDALGALRTVLTQMWADDLGALAEAVERDAGSRDLVVEQEVAAPPDVVFDYFTTAETCRAAPRWPGAKIPDRIRRACAEWP